jgi:hypothetical protein
MTLPIGMDGFLHNSITHFVEFVSQSPDLFEEENLPNLEKAFEEYITKDMSAECARLQPTVDALAAEVANQTQSQAMSKRERAKHMNNAILRNHELRRKVVQKRGEHRNIGLDPVRPLVKPQVDVRMQCNSLRAQCRDLRGGLSMLRSEFASFSSGKLVLIRQLRIAVVNYVAQHRPRIPRRAFGDIHGEIRACRKMNRTLMNAMELISNKDFSRAVADRKRAVVARESGIEDPVSIPGIAGKLCESVKAALKEKDHEVEAGLQALSRRHAVLINRIRIALNSAAQRIDVSVDVDNGIRGRNPIAVLSRTMDEISRLRRSRVIGDYGLKHSLDQEADLRSPPISQEHRVDRSGP